MTLYELPQATSRPLSLECPFPEARAILAGDNRGWVFVDDPSTPGAGLVWARGIAGFYLIGDPNRAGFLEELDSFTEQILKPRLQGLGMTWVEISGDASWNPVIEHAYRKRALAISQQWVYSLTPAKGGSVRQIETTPDPRLKRVDRRLLVDLSAASGKFLFSKLTRYWHSVDNFIKAGLGYALLDGAEIVSLCFSGFVAGNVHAIDIETRETRRRKGYAELVARAFLAACLVRGFQPHWECEAENTASARLAEKLGFKKDHEYTLYSFPL